MSMLTLNPVRRFADRTVNTIVRAIPAANLKNGKILNGLKWVGQHVSSPENRLILGVTALASQPFIDLHNRSVDERTKKVSAARTVAKIIAGTTTGVIIRYACIAAAKKFTKAPSPLVNKIFSIFYPKGTKVVTQKGLNKYIDWLGTALSLAVMLFTNFAIDAPLTKYLTNKFIKKIDKNNIAPVNRTYITIDDFINSSRKEGINA